MPLKGCPAIPAAIKVHAMNRNASSSLSLSGRTQPSKPEDENADPVGDPSTNQEPEDEDADEPVEGDSNAGAERTGNGGSVQRDASFPASSGTLLK